MDRSAVLAAPRSPDPTGASPTSRREPDVDRVTLALYRVAVMVVAAWSLLATTVLVGFLAEGGLDALTRLVRSPAILFTSGATAAWEVGAIGAFCLFALAFAISQVVGRGLLGLLRPEPLPWPTGIATPGFPVRLLAYRSAKADAFTFTLLVPRFAWRWSRQEVILISRALLDVLEPAEWEAVVAHELGHVRGLDGRYLTFLRTFARLMRWDPILAAVASRLTRREELRADLDAVALTGRPRALARAIYKAVVLAAPGRTPGTALLGPGGRAGERQALERIRRLVALAESGRYGEEGGA